MNFHYIKLSLKNLLKNKLITGINISGLALGITISLLIFSYVGKELNMDRHVKNIDNIFVLTEGSPNISARMTEHIRNNVPEISHITFADYAWSPQVFVEHNNVDIKIDHLLVADSAFFKVFQFEAIYGNLVSALNSSNKIVLTQTLAQKIFGKEDPLGKTIKYNSTNLQDELVEVVAVIKDMPHNSSWGFEAVLSVDTNRKIDWYDNLMKQWGTQNYSSFFRIPDHIDPSLVKEKLVNITTEGIPESYKDDTHFGMVPFVDSYCDLHDIEILKHGNHLTLSIIRITGFLILFLACINYINLVTAQKLKRLRNIGILKVLGSKKHKIVELTTSESAIVMLATSVLVFTLTYFILDEFNVLTNSQFTLAEIFSDWNLLIFIAILLSTIVITGVVPGISFGKYQTTLLLKNTSNTSNKNYLRNALLVFQFTISIILICGILFINKQNNFLSEMNPGFKKENIIYTTTNKQIKANIDAFKNELNRIPGISDLTFSSALIGYNQANWGLDITNKGEIQEIGLANFYVSPNFFNFFGLEISRGQNFDDYSDENNDWIFNQSATKEFNIDQLADVKIKPQSKRAGNIIGEVKDFNFESMHVPIRSVGFLSAGDVSRVAYIKVNSTSGNNLKKCIDNIQTIWDQLSPNFPLEINHLNSSWEALYRKDREFQQILNYTTVISLLLSCLGLISLTFFVVETHIKEIGIRKVNGAKAFEIISMLNKDLIKWVLIAFILACPISYLALNLWLDSFAYKTELSWWVFGSAGIIALGIALLTVSWQSWRAAKMNPVESLRYE